MPIIDIYVGEDEQKRKRRRRKWIIPIIIGVSAALALGRDKPPVLPPAPTIPVVVPPPPTAQTETVVVEPPTVQTPEPPPPVFAHIAVAPALLDFGNGAVTRERAAQIATIHNDGNQTLARISAVVDGPFLATSGCAAELAPGDQCMIAVVFTPRRPGNSAGSLRIAAGEQRARVSLRGSVPPEIVNRPPPPNPVPVPVPPLPAPIPTPPSPLSPARMLCFEPAYLRFTSTGKQTITLTNPEPTPLKVIAVLPIGRQGQTVSGYEVDARKCLRVLKPRQQCKFTVRANELALQTRETMQLTVYYDDPITGGTRPARFNTECGNR